jgi:pyruvate dehydrogenase E2 component (dihydrolipoamide acetyltransferase)
MAEELFIPKLGQTVEEVTLLNWLVEDGSKVEFGTPVLDVETDKAVFSVEANAKGYIHFGTHSPGEVLPVLTVVATIGGKEEVFSSKGVVETVPAVADAEEKVENKTQLVPEAEVKPSSLSAESERRFVSPRARKAAAENGVDLLRVTPTGGEGARIIEKDVHAYLVDRPKVTPVAANLASQAGVPLGDVQGTGIHGMITKADVENAIENAHSPQKEPLVQPGELPVPADEVSSTIPLRGVKKVIFERMGTSVHTTARVTLVTEADATELVEARKRINEDAADSWGFKLGFNDLIGLIAARALREYPYMNARVSQDGRAVELLSAVNLGMAVDTPRGLLVPVIRDADQKTLREFGAVFRELVERARTGRSLPEDLSGGTFTITNLGMYDIDAFTPVINLPEVAILGVGRILEKVVPYKGEIRIRQRLTLSLVFDHRLNDGAPAARFLQAIKGTIENPYLLIG